MRVTQTAIETFVCDTDNFVSLVTELYHLTGTIHRVVIDIQSPLNVQFHLEHNRLLSLDLDNFHVTVKGKVLYVTLIDAQLKDNYNHLREVDIMVSRAFYIAQFTEDLRESTDAYLSKWT